MRRNWIVLLALVFLARAEAAGAAHDCQIGLFTDENASVCGAELTLFSSLSVYIVAKLDSDISSIVAVEFDIENIPSTGGGQASTDWTSSLVLGNIGQGISVAWGEPLYGPNVLIGRVDFLAMSDAWMGDGYRIQIGPSPQTGEIALVDADYATHNDVWGGRFTFNCDGDQECACGQGGAQEASWGRVKNLF